MKTRRYYTFKEHLKESLKNPEFRKAWEDSEVEYQLSRKLIEARLSRNLSQRDLARRVKTSQAAISRIEGMNGNPSLALLKRIATALDTKLSISLTK
ncbi:MAG TPA: helix-turn-helix transcriptional regulator [Xanthomonadales bacterium]|nr:helix-turn-helix transcriptional regulator [Xanthomonadales bacterium]